MEVWRREVRAFWILKYNQNPLGGKCMYHRVSKLEGPSAVHFRLCSWSYLVNFLIRNLSYSPCSEPSRAVLLLDVIHNSPPGPLPIIIPPWYVIKVDEKLKVSWTLSLTIIYISIKKGILTCFFPYLRMDLYVCSFIS